MKTLQGVLRGAVEWNSGESAVTKQLADWSQERERERARERERRCRWVRRWSEHCWDWAPKCTPTPSGNSLICAVSLSSLSQSNPNLPKSLFPLSVCFLRKKKSLSFLFLVVKFVNNEWGYWLQIHGNTFWGWVWELCSWTSWWNGTLSSKKTSTRCWRKPRPPTNAVTLVNSPFPFLFFYFPFHFPTDSYNSFEWKFLGNSL